jgi:hypothetical protein
MKGQVSIETTGSPWEVVIYTNDSILFRNKFVRLSLLRRIPTIEDCQRMKLIINYDRYETLNPLRHFCANDNLAGYHRK